MLRFSVLIKAKIWVAGERMTLSVRLILQFFYGSVLFPSEYLISNEKEIPSSSSPFQYENDGQNAAGFE